MRKRVKGCVREGITPLLSLKCKEQKEENLGRRKRLDMFEYFVP